MERSNWTVAFSWVKAHAGIFGNELADHVAKTAARAKDKTTSYSTIPLSTLFWELEEESKLKWQKKWEESPKAAKKTILSKNNRQTQIENIHYLKLHSYGFRTRQNQSLPSQIRIIGKCNMSLQQGRSHYGHLLYHCTLLQQQRELLGDTLKHGIWPISKHNLITKHMESFMKCTNSIDFDKPKRCRCNCKVVRDIIQWLYIVKGMQRPTPRAEADPASLPIIKNQ